MKLVCITGIDGTGKTTLARNTAQALQEQGQPARYIYGRTVPVLSRLLMALGRMTMLRAQNPWQDYEGYTASKKQTMRNPLLAMIYTVAILLDYYLQIWLKLLPHLFTTRIILSDRYLYDTVISDLVVHLNYSQEETERAIEWGMKFLPRPMRTILIDVPEEVAFARKDDVPHVDYLRERRKWYLTLQKRAEVKRFNGEEAPQKLVEALLADVAAHHPVMIGEMSQ